MLLSRADHNEEMALQKYLLDPTAYSDDELRSLLLDGCEGADEGNYFHYDNFPVLNKIVGTRQVENDGLAGSIARTLGIGGYRKEEIRAFSPEGIKKTKKREDLEKMAAAYVGARLKELMLKKFEEANKVEVFSRQLAEFINRTGHNPASKVWQYVVDSCANEPGLSKGSQERWLRSSDPLVAKMEKDLSATPVTHSSGGHYTADAFSSLRIFSRECSPAESQAMSMILADLYANPALLVSSAHEERAAVAVARFMEASKREAAQEMKEESKGLRKGLESGDAKHVAGGKKSKGDAAIAAATAQKAKQAGG